MESLGTRLDMYSIRLHVYTGNTVFVYHILVTPQVMRNQHIASITIYSLGVRN